MEQAKKTYGIGVWFHQELLTELVAFAKAKGAKGSRDDIVRLVEISASMGMQL